MNNERIHPRDQNSPQVQTMMDELRATAAGIDCAATYPLSPDYTFDIPAGLIPGVDNKLPTSGLIIIYTHPDTDVPERKTHIQAIMNAIDAHLEVVAGSTNFMDLPTSRQFLRKERHRATIAGKLVIELRTLTRAQAKGMCSDPTELEADLTLYFVPGINKTIILQRGKLRRSVAAGTNLAMTLPHL